MKKVEALFERARTDALSPDEMEKLWRSVGSAGPGGGSGFEGPSGSGGGAFGGGGGRVGTEPFHPCIFLLFGAEGAEYVGIDSGEKKIK